MSAVAEIIFMTPYKKKKGNIFTTTTNEETENQNENVETNNSLFIQHNATEQHRYYLQQIHPSTAPINSSYMWCIAAISKQIFTQVI